MKMVGIARRIKPTDFTGEIRWRGSKITTFLEIKNCWRCPNVQGVERNRNSMYYVAYGYILERKFLQESGWSYCEESKKVEQSKNRWRGYEVKVCIAQIFSHVKHELVKQLQKAGKDLNDNSKFAKSRRGSMKEGMMTKQRKKRDYYFKSFPSLLSNMTIV